jgi:hypothetical protein
MTKQNKISIIALFFVISLLHIACANEKRSPIYVDNYIEFDTITVIERHHLSGDTLNPSYCEVRINFVFPISSKKISVDTLQHFFVESVFGLEFSELSPLDAVHNYTRRFIENYIADARIFSENAREHTANARMSDIGAREEYLMNDVFFSYYEKLSNVITYNQHGILAFQVKQSNKRSGFIAFDSFRNYVIDLQTGTQVTEYDIFNSGYDIALQRIIIASLLEQNGVRAIDELENLGFFGIEEIVPNGNFLLDDNGITYTFNKGEYSVYQINAPVVFIPFGAIRALLRRDGVAARLADL